MRLLMYLLSAMNLFSKTDTPPDKILSPFEKIQQKYEERVGVKIDAEPGKEKEAETVEKTQLEKLLDGKPAGAGTNPDEESIRKKFWSEHFGDKPIEQIKTSLNQLTEYEKRLRDLEPYKSKYETLEKEHEALSQQSSFHNEKFFRLDKLYAKNPTEAEIIEKVMYPGALPMDILMSEFMLENPEYKDKPDEAKRLLINKGGYDYDTDPENTNDDEENERAKAINEKRRQKVEANMKFDAMQAKKKIMQRLDSIELPKKLTPEEIEKQKKEKDATLLESKNKLVAKWTEPYGKLIDEVMSPEKIIYENDDKKMEIELKIPDSELKHINKSVAQFIDMNNYDPTPENIGLIVSVMRMGYFNSPEGKKEYVKQIAEKVRQMTEDEYMQFIHNPASRENKSTPPGRGEKKVSKREESFTAGLAAMKK